MHGQKHKINMLSLKLGFQDVFLHLKSEIFLPGGGFRNFFAAVSQILVKGIQPEWPSDIQSNNSSHQKCCVPVDLNLSNSVSFLIRALTRRFLIQLPPTVNRARQRKVKEKNPVVLPSQTAAWPSWGTVSFI